MGSESTPEAVTQVVTTPSKEMEMGLLDGGVLAPEATAQTPPEGGSKKEGEADGSDKDGADSVDATPRPLTTTRVDGDGGEDDEATPRPAGR